MTTPKHNKFITYCLVLALSAMACMPQGYMVSRSADNLVEIVICRGYGEHPKSLYLDMETGEYVERDANSEMPDSGNAPCHFSVVSFAIPEMSETLASLKLQSRRVAETVRRWDITHSFYEQAKPRGPPQALA